MDHPQKPTVPEVPITPWAWPLDVEIYDRAPALSSQEKEALTAFLLPRRQLAQMVSTASQQGRLTRLMQPLSDVFTAIEGEEQAKIEWSDPYRPDLKESQKCDRLGTESGKGEN